MQMTRVLVPCLVLALFPNCADATANRTVTDYCLAEDVDASTGGGTSDLGKFVMKARLTITDGHYVLDAWNVMPDNSQTLEIHADGTYRRQGPTPIRFIDNFNKRGKGHFVATKTAFHIDIDRVTEAPEGSNIGRNYGAYDLKSARCKWDRQ